MLLKVRCLFMSRILSKCLALWCQKHSVNYMVGGNFRSLLGNRRKEPEQHVLKMINLVIGLTVLSSVWCAGSVSGIGLIWALHVSTAILRLLSCPFLSFGFSLSSSFCTLVLKVICSSGIKIEIDIRLKRNRYSLYPIMFHSITEEAAWNQNGLHFRKHFLLPFGNGKVKSKLKAVSPNMNAHSEAGIWHVLKILNM